MSRAVKVLVTLLALSMAAFGGMTPGCSSDSADTPVAPPPPPPPPPDDQCPQNLTGLWTGTINTVTPTVLRLTQSGTQIEGTATYPGDDVRDVHGSVTGTQALLYVSGTQYSGCYCIADRWHLTWNCRTLQGIADKCECWNGYTGTYPLSFTLP